MGQGFKFECQECGYSSNAFFGIGFLYPNVCEEILQNMKNGVFGEKLKEDANTISHAAIHQRSSLFVCDNCGNWRVDDIIDLCAPIQKSKKNNQIFSVTNEAENLHSYVMDADIGETYRVVGSVEHKCDCCQQNMRAIKESKIVKLKLKCPNCSNHLIIHEAYGWD